MQPNQQPNQPQQQMQMSPQKQLQMQQLQQQAALSPMAPKVQPTANMYSQLETMMNAVKKEAKSLEAVKQKIREMDGLKATVGDLQGQLGKAEQANAQLQSSLQESEGISSQLRSDMQRLNDIYNKEHDAYATTQQTVLKLEADVRNAANEMQFYQKEAQRIPDLRQKNQALISQIGTLQKVAEEERQIAANTTATFEEKLREAAASKAEQTKQFWQIAEEVKALKAAIADKDLVNRDSDSIIADLKAKARLAQDREEMTTEEAIGLQASIQGKINQYEAELAASRAESDSLRDILTHKEDQTVVRVPVSFSLCVSLSLILNHTNHSHTPSLTTTGTSRQTSQYRGAAPS